TTPALLGAMQSRLRTPLAGADRSSEGRSTSLKQPNIMGSVGLTIAFSQSLPGCNEGDCTPYTGGSQLGDSQVPQLNPIRNGGLHRPRLDPMNGRVVEHGQPSLDLSTVACADAALNHDGAPFLGMRVIPSRRGSHSKGNTSLSLRSASRQI